MTAAGTGTSPLVVRAYAKINLGLQVLSRRTDGYHELETILQTIDFYDRLTFERRESGLELTSDEPALPNDAENLVLRAAVGLRQWAGVEAGAAIHLEKRIPMGAGLGGGSSDAAVTLLALSRLWGLEPSPSDLHRLAGELGMDVPFFLQGGTALARGRGDELTPIRPGMDRPIVLILPNFSISTASAYRSLILTKTRSSSTLQHFAVGDLSGQRGLSELSNDLEGATGDRSSSIRSFKRMLVGLGARIALMSGSGSAVFGLFDDDDRAHAAATEINRQGTRSVATRTLTGASYRQKRFVTEP